MAEGMQEIQEARPRRFRPYPEYKDSGVDWLGGVPAGWQAAKMGYLATTVSGGTPNKDNPEFWNGDIPWVSPKDMKVRIVRDATDHVSSAALAQTGLKLVQPPAVLIVVRGMILAHSFPVAVTAVPVTINQDMKALQLSRELRSDFFSYLIEGLSAYFLSLIEEAGHGTKRLRSDLWRSTHLYLPPRGEQQAIASFLDRETAKIDELVAKKERLIELLQEKRTALITRAVTQGLDPTVPMKDSGVEWLGKIPAHWETKSLSRILVRITYGFTNPMPVAESGPFMLTALDVGDGEILFGSARRTTEEAFDGLLTDKSRPRTDDLLVTKDGTLGRVAICQGQRMCINQSVALLRFKQEMDVRFVQHALRAVPYQQRMIFEAGGTAIKHIYITRLARMHIAVPQKDEQRSIAAFLEEQTAKADALILTVREAVERLGEFRTALVSAAVTGKLDVREQAP